MNKREAIEKIYTASWNDSYHEGLLVDVETVNKIIYQIDEPQKPVVPKFMVDWIEDHKGDVSKWDEEDRADFVFMAINDLFRFVEGLKPLDFIIDEKVSKWMIKNTYKFITAILFGYTVEKEKLYTVEIPNPNLTDTVTLLYKENGKVFIGNEFFWDEVPNYKWKKHPQSHLTESEIKQDFEWAWDAGFAKPVEEN